MSHTTHHVPYHMPPHYLQIWPSVLYQNILHSGLIVVELYLAQIRWSSSNSRVSGSFSYFIVMCYTGLRTFLGKDIGDWRLPDEQILGQSVSRTLYQHVNHFNKKWVIIQSFSLPSTDIFHTDINQYQLNFLTKAPTDWRRWPSCVL